jgi:succinate dehydrogenase/fumarate reductase flavoprotein subunit
MMVENVIETDILVIGGGMSGLFAAMKAREQGMSVTVVEKGYAGRSGAVFSAEGFYAVFNPAWGHNLNDWKAEIAKYGDYLNNPEWTEVCLKDSYERYQDLQSWGVRYIEGKDGRPMKWHRGPLESGVLGMGWTYFPAMRAIMLKNGIRIVDRIMTTDLLTQEGRVTGAVGFHVRSGELYVFKARATVVCTGGGDGEAMAYQAGAEISGKEFLMGTGAYSYAGPEYYGDKGDGEKVDITGKEIKPPPAGGWIAIANHYIDRYVDAEGRKVNRYTVGSAVHDGRGPMLWNVDAATEKEIEDTLREIEQGGTGFKQERVGFDLRQRGIYRGIPVGASGMGGLHGFHGGGSGISSVDTECTTNIPGLYAAGDAYHSRTVGAKYPFWGFGLCNASVTGARAGRSAAQYAAKVTQGTVNQDELIGIKNRIYSPLERQGGFDKDWVNGQLRNITGPYYVYLVRHGDRLTAALTMVEFLKNHVAPRMYAKPRDAHGLVRVLEAKNAILSAEMALRAAFFRTESRGCHFREDYPRRDDPNWLALVKIRNKDGEMELVKEPLPAKWWPDLSRPYRERYRMEFPGGG